MGEIRGAVRRVPGVPGHVKTIACAQAEVDSARARAFAGQELVQREAWDACVLRIKVAGGELPIAARVCVEEV